MLPQRTALTDVEVAGVTVPKGAPLILVLASGNRDPKRFHNPDHFDPTRRDNQHFGFGSGVHICFGAPLAERDDYNRRQHENGGGPYGTRREPRYPPHPV